MNAETTVDRSAVESMSAEEMSERIRDFSRGALGELADRREKAYMEICANFAEQLTALTREGDSLETEIRSTVERLGSVERVTRFEADKLIVQGKREQAREKLRELEESKGELARIEARRGEIAERCRQIEAAKLAELRRGAETFLSDCTGLIRGAEGALALILDGARNTLNHLETQLGASLYQPAQLTASEQTGEWRTLNRLYSGRTR